MIDIHAHFLPGMDDGAASVNESVKMLCDAYNQGVTVCAGTSHIVLHGEKSIDSFLKKRQDAVFELEKALAENDISVPKLLYGAEIFIDNDISEYSGLERLCLTGTPLLLVELSTQTYNPDYAEWLYSITLKGIVPVIAHIERYPYIQELLSELDSVNVVCQMNAKTIIKNNWFKFLLKLYHDEKSILVASDMHNLGMRKCFMEKSYNKVKNYYSQDVADDIFERTAAKLIGIDVNK